MSTGLYIGRFQPLHLGHLSAIKQALQNVEKLTIGIGSSQYHDTPDNPFTSQERQKMLEISLKELNLEEKCEIFLIPDIHDEEKWVKHVKKIVPPFEKVFVGNEGLVKKLFEENGDNVLKVDQKINISATKIRKAMKEGTDWKSMISPKLAQYIESIQGQVRVKKLQEV